MREVMAGSRPRVRPSPVTSFPAINAAVGLEGQSPCGKNASAQSEPQIGTLLQEWILDAAALEDADEETRLQFPEVPTP